MNNTPQPHDSNDRLSREIHRVLRAQPDRAAPDSLEARVFAGIERRAALPWWRQSFARWPIAARAAFMIVSAALAAVMIVTFARVLNIVPAQIESRTGALVSDYWEIITGYCARYLAGIPSHVFAIAAAVIGACYAALFGLGAAAYRYFWKPGARHSEPVSHT
ncbi:hypothetical protein M2447_000460 [Ereboglobus sp. PH5-10]|uniref:hypothetical protein n=1 Tax=Ereboglobus sp. PH5-10 TaxID=2940629 RepID=UPI0024066861|nr:hypothetical protein [Ereboglobus sp. PH5-10]MDF9826379.1 hypothetical protein [Ereboglobus sp. PH5-10]